MLSTIFIASPLTTILVSSQFLCVIFCTPPAHLDYKISHLSRVLATIYIKSARSLGLYYNQQGHAIKKSQSYLPLSFRRSVKHFLLRIFIISGLITI